MILASTVILLLSVFITLAYTFWIGSKSFPTSSNSVQPEGLDMVPYILWKSFYINPDDPRGWLPKKNQLGSTINFRTKKNVYLFIFCLGFNIASSIFLLLSI